MKDFDKAYITFVFDDGRMPFTKECFNLFSEYDIYMKFVKAVKNVRLPQPTTTWTNHCFLWKTVNFSGAQIPLS